MTLETLYQWSWIFFIYAFLGWCVEVIFHAVSEGKFINRGFLIGPLCPIYGLGVLIVVLCLEPVRDKPLLLFAGSVILTSVLEFLTALILEKLFNEKWWDYSTEPLNLCGYICIRFSLAWGLACIIVVDVIYPITLSLIGHIPYVAGLALLCVLYSLLFTDLTVTLIETLKLRRLLIVAGNAEKGLRKVSDGIGEVLASGTRNALEMIEESKEAVELRKEKAKSGLSKVQKRILNAYPHLKEGRYKDSISRLKERFKNEVQAFNKK